MVLLPFLLLPTSPSSNHLRYAGMLMSFSQLWLQECTPAQFRGLALSAFQFWTSIGTLVSPQDCPLGRPGS